MDGEKHAVSLEEAAKNLRQKLTLQQDNDLAPQPELLGKKILNSNFAINAQI